MVRTSAKRSRCKCSKPNRPTDGICCEACCKRGDLRLKVLAHYGEFMVKRVSRFEELAGDEVILIHRLLKNQVPANEYLLLTEAAASLMPGSQS